VERQGINVRPHLILETCEQLPNFVVVMLSLSYTDSMCESVSALAENRTDVCVLQVRAPPSKISVQIVSEFSE
jgi:hypothetical protein